MEKVQVKLNKKNIMSISHNSISGGQRLRTLETNDYNKFSQWTLSYQEALKEVNFSKQLFTIGQDMYNWLGGEDSWIADIDEEPLLIEFEIPRFPSNETILFIEAPWELLADENCHLAKNSFIRYCPIRRIGNTSKSNFVSKYRLCMVFMAASPRDSRMPLNYEAEENAILNINDNQPSGLDMDFFIEESGSIDLLLEKMRLIDQVDVVHLSCHGNNQPQPVLLLENHEGVTFPISPSRLKDTFNKNMPRLLFLSACFTGTLGQTDDNKPAESYSLSLVQHKFPAVLGWSGSVSDREATYFASLFYKYLSQDHTIEEALAQARYLLLNTESNELENESRDWHLARLYLGINGGSKLTGNRGKRNLRSIRAGHKEFLDKKHEVKVAGRMEFVGRRRQIQDILKAFRSDDKHCVLIHGIGNQGKSSLAARIANRMHDHKTVVIYKYYDALNILNILKTEAEIGYAGEIIEKTKGRIADDSSYFETGLKELLLGPFSTTCTDKGNKKRPILLIIDDCERILNPPKSGSSEQYNVDKDHKSVLTAIIKAFKHTETESRLIITSRFTFTLLENKQDLSKYLYHISLPSMSEIEGRKQVQARLGSQKTIKTNLDTINIQRLICAANGNPGLLELLFSLAVEDRSAYNRALRTIEEYINERKITDDSQAQEFLEKIAIKEIYSLLSDTEKKLLSFTKLFILPIPRPIIEIIAKVHGISDKDASIYINRLTGLGTWEIYDDIVELKTEALYLNNLIRPMIADITDEEQKLIAQSIVESLYWVWGGDDIESISWYCDYELAKLSLIAENNKILLASVEYAILGLREDSFYKEAAFLVIETIKQLHAANVSIPLSLYNLGIDICIDTGNIDEAHVYIDRAIEVVENIDTIDTIIDNKNIAGTYLSMGRFLMSQGETNRAKIYFEKGIKICEKNEMQILKTVIIGELVHSMMKNGKLEQAMTLSQQSLEIYKKIGDRHGEAITLSKIARIYAQKGEVEQALKYYDEIVTTCEDIGDIKGKAVIYGEIANIMIDKGKLEQAFIYLNYNLNIYDKIGYIKGIASTISSIARVMRKNGEIDQAIVHYKKALEIDKKLGDKQAKAITLSDIASILAEKNEIELAEKYYQEVLTISDQLSDIRGKATALGGIARIITAKGEFENAIALHQQRLNIYEKLGDQQGKAITFGDIARITTKKGNIEEALAFHQQSLEIYESLNDQLNKAITLGDIASILTKKSEFERAMALHEQELEIYESLEDHHNKAITFINIARILQTNGDLKQAKKTFQMSLEIIKKLGDKQYKAIVLGDIARIYTQKGEVEQSLTYFKEALSICEEINDMKGKAIILNETGRILTDKGEFEDALSLHQQSLTIYEKLDQQRKSAITLGNIARIMTKKGDVDQALKLHYQEIEIYENINDQRSKAVTLEDIARIMKTKGKVKKALTLYKQALIIYESIEDEYCKAVNFGNVGQLLASIGKFDEAFDMQMIKLEIVRRLNESLEIAIALYDIAQIELTQKKGQEAFNHLSESYDLFMESGKLDGISLVGILLGQFLCANDRKDDGLKILRRSEVGLKKLGLSVELEEVQEIIKRVENN